MTVDLTGDQEAAIMEIAERDGKSAGEVLVETARWLHDLSENENERRILDERIAAADRGGFLSQTEVDQRFQKMLRRS